MKLVAENRTLLEAFAFLLLENEVLEREDIERLMTKYMADLEDAGNGRPVRQRDPVPELEPGPAALAASEPPAQSGADSPSK
jgi:hypothetical protein